ncbi:hypothetical protein PFISCL1PPCAC_4550, partial [Pristionchus fissidentatus]
SLTVWNRCPPFTVHSSPVMYSHLEATQKNLLERSEAYKAAARELLEAQVSAKTDPEATEEQKLTARIAEIRLIAPEERTAVQFLELMQAIYVHAADCRDYGCVYQHACWRMRGLRYRVERLKKKEPSVFAAVWNRHVILEMHTESCYMTDKCYCTNIDHYRYFLKHALKDFTRMEKELMERQEDVRKRLALEAMPIVAFFQDQIIAPEKIGKADKDPKRPGARWLIHQIWEGTLNGFHNMKDANANRPSLNEVIRTERERLRAARADVRPCILDRDGCCDCKCAKEIDPALPGTSEGLQRSANDSEISFETIAAEYALNVGTPEWRLQQELLYPISIDCDHAPEKMCHCTINDTPVDLGIGMRFKLPPRIKRCANEISADMRTEIVDMVSARLKERAIIANRPLVGEPRVATISCYYKGEKWRAVYC